jgi:SAM-dependent methyltransferase
VTDAQPRIYTDLASWYPLLTAPEEYDEEATFYWGCFQEAAEGAGTGPLKTLLELGAGAGANAYHYKQWVTPVLTDLSPDMLALSQKINPELRHIQADMRTLRLGETFDAVFVHDAVDYMLTVEDLRQAMTTAFVHLRPGGVALFAVMMALTAARCATWNGATTPTQTTRWSRRTSCTCSGRATRCRAPWWTAISTACSAGPSGNDGWKRSGSSG